MVIGCIVHTRSKCVKYINQTTRCHPAIKYEPMHYVYTNSLKIERATVVLLLLVPAASCPGVSADQLN
jgi:hypothetical protein